MPRLAVLVAALALGVLAAPLFLGLGRTDLDGDEAIYAGVVERMVAGGPWLTPPDENGPFLEKPPLRFWIVATVLSTGLLPPTEAGHRIVDTVLGACAIAYVFALAFRLGGLAAGVGAVFLVVVQGPLLFVHGLRSGTMEPLLVLSYCGAVAHCFSWGSGRGTRHAVAVGAWCGVAVLAKFAAAAPLVVVIAASIALVPEWRARARADRGTWLRAVALFAVLAVPWFVLQTVRYGFEVWGWILGHHVLARVTSAVDPAHVQPWWFYVWSIGRAFKATWEYVAVGAIVLLARLRRRGDTSIVPLGLWFAVPVVLFSLATSKLIHYVYPALPALAVIGGQAFAAALDLVRGVRKPVRIAAFVGVIALVAFDVQHEYARAIRNARRLSRPWGALAECVSARAGRPISFHLHVDRELERDEKYYLARMGTVAPGTAPEPGAIAVRPGRGLVVFLTAEFAPCATAASGGIP